MLARAPTDDRCHGNVFLYDTISTEKNTKNQKYECYFATKTIQMYHFSYRYGYGYSFRIFQQQHQERVDALGQLVGKTLNI